MGLEKEEQDKLRLLLDAGGFSVPTATGEMVSNNNHVHNYVCERYSPEYRTFTGSCGHPSSLKWNELKIKALSIRDTCLVCSIPTKHVLYTGHPSKVEEAVPFTDLVPLCLDHNDKIERKWAQYIDSIPINSRPSRDNYALHRLSLVFREALDLQSTLSSEQANNLETNNQAKIATLTKQYEEASLANSPRQLAKKLNMSMEQLNRRAPFLNISWQDDNENLDYLTYTRLKLSLTSVERIHFIEYPDLDMCVVCNNFLTDYNVIDDRFDSYVCAGLTPNWDIETVPDGSHKCWQTSRGNRRWKDSFPTLAVARDYMTRAAVEHGENPRSYSAYKCSNCFRYHFGHNKRR